MSNIIRVTIFDPVNHILETHDYDGENVVHKHKDQQPITWELDVEARVFRFTAIVWEGLLAPEGTFKPAQFTHGGHTMKVNDLNDKSSTGGDFLYQLHAVIDGVPYHTELTSAPSSSDPKTMAIRDPIIINR